MSKLIDMYKNLKQESPETLYLFKAGLFYIFLDEDAKLISNIFSLKLTNLNSSFVKCGFPANSLNKYMKILNCTQYEVKIIDNTTNTTLTPKEFELNQNTINLLKTISNIDNNNLSIKEAYDFISNIKNVANKILKEVNKNEAKN